MSSSMMLELVISGGQTGADQAGWRAAKASGIPTGGWMPKGFKTEAGPRPEFAGLYGAKEHRSMGYRDRTIANLAMAKATILFGNPRSAGGRLAIGEGNRLCVFVYTVFDSENPEPSLTVDFLRQIRAATINVAGNRESSSPGIGEWVERYMLEVFRLLREG